MNKTTTMQAIDTQIFAKVRAALLEELPLATTTAHTREMMAAVQSAKPTTSPQAVPGVQVMQLQGERSDATGIEMAADPRAISFGELKAIAEALAGDLRVLPATEYHAARIYRRAYTTDGRSTSKLPAAWRPLGSADSFYGSSTAPKAVNLATPLSYALASAGQVIYPGLRIDASDGSLVLAWHDGEYVRLEAPKGGEPIKAVGKGDGHDGRAVGVEGMGALTTMPVTDADRALLRAPLTQTVATDMTLAEVEDARATATRIYRMWTPTTEAATNLALMAGAPAMQSHPEKAYWLVGQGGTGKSSLAKEIVRFYNGIVENTSISYLGMPGVMAAENAMAVIQRQTATLFDEVSTAGFSRWWEGLKSLTTGLLPFAPRRIGQDASQNATAATVCICTSNRVIPIGTDSASQRRVRIIAMTGAGYTAFRRLVDGGLVWAFILAGATAWVARRGLHAASSVWVDPEALTSEEIAVLSAVVSTTRASAPEGYVRGALVPRGVEPRALGLVRKRLNLRDDEGKRVKVWCWVPAEEGSTLRPTWEATKAAFDSLAGTDDGDDGDEPPTPPTPPADGPKDDGPTDDAPKSANPADYMSPEALAMLQSLGGPSEPDEPMTDGDWDDFLGDMQARDEEAVEAAGSEDGGDCDDLLAGLFDAPSTAAEPEGKEPTSLLDMVDDQKADTRFGMTGDLEQAAETLEKAGVHGQIITCKGGADYAQAKRPLASWKSAEEAAKAAPDRLEVFDSPSTTGAAALVLSPDAVAVDLDLPKGEDASLPTGEELLGRLAPDAVKAARAVVRTASGGLHLIFDAPAEELVNRAHPCAGVELWKGGPAYKAGVPVDIRTSRGYVVMAGSKAAGRQWRLEHVTDRPDEAHPMPADLFALLDRLGFVKETPSAEEEILRTLAPKRLDPLTGLAAERTGAPDLTPIPEGQRNSTLHAWAYGRAVNHAEEWPRIQRETMQRGQSSGLSERECVTILRSVARELGLNA